MRVVLFCQSLLSDWNHGNVHFLRGIATELLERGHQVSLFEPRDSWSYSNLVAEGHESSMAEFEQTYPGLKSVFYSLDTLDAERAIEGADLILFHEWNSPLLLEKLGRAKERLGAPKLLFHDTHHRAVTEPERISEFPLELCDGVLAFGESLRRVYLDSGWAKRVFTWHEAADTRVFYPRDCWNRDAFGDIVWIGNWGDDERSEALREFFIEPVRELNLRATVYGVRYPAHALELLQEAGIRYMGHLPNPKVPQVFAAHRVTVHIPRKPYVELLPGIPTIRPFEAMACGIPLVSAFWDDCEHLFRPGADYLIARNGSEMKKHLSEVLSNPDHAGRLKRNGQDIIVARHTCAHRVDQLFGILKELEIREPAALCGTA